MMTLKQKVMFILEYAAMLSMGGSLLIFLIRYSYYSEIYGALPVLILITLFGMSMLFYVIHLWATLSLDNFLVDIKINGFNKW